MKYLTKVNPKKLKGVALLRLDFNTEDDWRMRTALPTIKFLLRVADKIVILSHRGRPSSFSLISSFAKASAGKRANWKIDKVNKKFSLKKDALRLQKLLGRKIRFIPHFDFPQIKKLIIAAPAGSIFVLENIRFLRGEEENDKKFAKKLAGLGDIYVNEAFSVSHREHASIVGIPKYLPSYAGLLFERELKNLQSVFKPEHPFLLILGGIKIKTKLGVLKRFLAIADKIFIGGALANNFFKVQGKDIGKSIFDPEIKVSKYLNNKKIILPIDVRWHEDKILDCGPKTIENLFQLIRASKFVLWNGPLGDFEKGFSRATFETARAIAKSNVKSIIGGGDTVSAIKKSGVSLEKFSFISTAGGAMLEFLAKGTLPGIKALEKRTKIQP
jgi:phosphoglycerate kinase